MYSRKNGSCTYIQPICISIDFVYNDLSVWPVTTVAKTPVCNYIKGPNKFQSYVCVWAGGGRGGIKFTCLPKIELRS